MFSIFNGVGEHFNFNRQRDSILEIHSFSVAKWLRILGSTRQTLIVTFIPLLSSLCPWASGFTSASSSVKREQLFTLQSVALRTERRNVKFFTYTGAQKMLALASFIEQMFMEYAGYLLRMTEMKSPSSCLEGSQSVSQLHSQPHASSSTPA